jgi:hypothetical protein
MPGLFILKYMVRPLLQGGDSAGLCEAWGVKMFFPKFLMGKIEDHYLQSFLFFMDKFNN